MDLEQAHRTVNFENSFLCLRHGAQALLTRRALVCPALHEQLPAERHADVARDLASYGGARYGGARVVRGERLYDSLRPAVRVLDDMEQQCALRTAG